MGWFEKRPPEPKIVRVVEIRNPFGHVGFQAQQRVPFMDKWYWMELGKIQRDKTQAETIAEWFKTHDRWNEEVPQ